jgi:hypothetical protein
LESDVEKSWKEAIKRVLSDADAPMHYTDICEQILARGYYETDGATPAATVNAQLAASIKHEGQQSPFVRVGKGIFALLPTHAPASPAPAAPKSKSKSTAISEAEVEASDSIIHAFGMYWQRDLIGLWANACMSTP